MLFIRTLAEFGLIQARCDSALLGISLGSGEQATAASLGL
jgi:hypothetical protein